MRSSQYLISNIIQNPASAASYSDKEWDLTIRLARRANILGILHRFICDEEIKREIPSYVFRHFESQSNLDKNYRDGVKRECQIIGEIMCSIDVPLVILKGAAYVVADLPVSYGRMFSDIDILVPKERIGKVEQVLKLHGWMTGIIDKYDDKYFREWMHEIPPLHHIKRGASLDVHHAILPMTTVLKPSSQLLLQDVVLLNEVDNIYVLSPVDMVLHSMTHLFHEGELEHGMRDLIDLDGLLKHYSKQDGDFWSKLVLRAKVLDLSIPLYYGLRYLKRLLTSPIPENAIIESELAIGGSKKKMDIFFDRALIPHHSSCSDWFTPFACWFLYVRSHYLRMPFRLLIPHLIRKAYMKRVRKNKTETAP